jgi:hypothetical protein
MKRIFWLLAVGSSVVWATPSLAAPSGKVLCYALANNESAPLNMPYTPDSRSAFNPNGGISVTHTGTGTYSVACFGVGTGGIGFETVGNVQVTAVGDNNTYCHLKSWSSGIVLANTGTIAATTPGTHIFFDQFDASVVCFGGGGTGGGPKDSEFSLMFAY